MLNNTIKPVVGTQVLQVTSKQNAVAQLSPVVVIAFPASNLLEKTEPSLLERWRGVEEWIQNSADEEFRTMYNGAEIGEVKVISDTELQELKRKMGVKDYE